MSGGRSAAALALLAAEVHAEVTAGPGDPGVLARRHLARLAPLLPESERCGVVDRVVARVRGLGVLEALIADPTVTEILVTAGRLVWVERAGELERAPVELAPGEAEHLVERVLGPLGVRADRTTPVADARLADGTRVHVVLPPVAPDGVCLSMRRFAPEPVPIDAFGNRLVVDVLEAAVGARLNIVVSGATSSGKTTLLNALTGFSGLGERIVTIEDACELRVPRPHVARLEARAATADGLGAVTICDLVRAALRMRPDRIVVGEVRGAEALDMLQALSTGHDGSLSTCHANDADDALRRLTTMAVQAGEALPVSVIGRLVHAAVDLVVHVERGTAGRRAVASIAEVGLASDGSPCARVLVDHGQALAVPRRVGRTERGPWWPR